MKLGYASGYTTDRRRSPRGERGLKLAKKEPLDNSNGSLPSRGAWIEIGAARLAAASHAVAPLAGSVD